MEAINHVTLFFPQVKVQKLTYEVVWKYLCMFYLKDAPEEFFYFLSKCRENIRS